MSFAVVEWLVSRLSGRGVLGSNLNKLTVQTSPKYDIFEQPIRQGASRRYKTSSNCVHQKPNEKYNNVKKYTAYIITNTRICNI